MDDNPYQSPRGMGDCGPSDSRRREEGQPPARWHPLTWAVVGFGMGTVLVAPLVLSVDPVTVAQGAMLGGGIPGAIVGWAFGRPRPLGGS